MLNIPTLPRLGFPTDPTTSLDRGHREKTRGSGDEAGVFVTSPNRRKTSLPSVPGTFQCTALRCEIASAAKMEWNFLSGAGALFLSYYSLNFILQILHGIRAFVLPALGIRKNLKKLGQWAGERALECAKFNLIF